MPAGARTKLHRALQRASALRGGNPVGLWNKNRAEAHAAVERANRREENSAPQPV